MQRVEGIINLKAIIDEGETPFPSGSFRIYLHANDSNGYYILEWSGEYSYVSTRPQLNAPTNLRFEGTVAKWDSDYEGEFVVSLRKSDGFYLKTVTVSGNQYDFNYSLMHEEKYYITIYTKKAIGAEMVSQVFRR